MSKKSSRVSGTANHPVIDLTTDGAAPVKSTYLERKPFLGKKITPANRIIIMENYYNIFMQKVATDEAHKDMTFADKERAANFYAKLEVGREKKHYEAWLKNKLFYSFKGQKYPVLRDVVKDQATYLSDVMDLEPFLEEE